MDEKLIPPDQQSKEAADMRKKLTDLLATIPRGKKESVGPNE
jgi:hypothetical protein